MVSVMLPGDGIVPLGACSQAEPLVTTAKIFAEPVSAIEQVCVGHACPWRSVSVSGLGAAVMTTPCTEKLTEMTIEVQELPEVQARVTVPS